jgi:hypothetical protein
VSEPDLSSSLVFTDARGTLIATELSDIPFSVQRVFVVHGPEGGATRGEHVILGAEMLVLLSGRVTIFIGPSADDSGNGITLTAPGERILLEVGQYVRYVLPDAGSEILVLCEQAFVSRI